MSHTKKHMHICHKNKALDVTSCSGALFEQYSSYALHATSLPFPGNFVVNHAVPKTAALISRSLQVNLTTTKQLCKLIILTQPLQLPSTLLMQLHSATKFNKRCL